MTEEKWKVHTEESFEKIPLFSKPYKINVIGIYEPDYHMPIVFATFKAFLKSHNETYLLEIDNGAKTVELSKIDLDKYLEIVPDKSKIIPFDNKLFIPKNIDGIVSSNIFSLTPGGTIYQISDEVQKELLSADKQGKEEFAIKLFGIEKVVPKFFKTDKEKQITKIIKNEEKKSYKSDTKYNLLKTIYEEKKIKDNIIDTTNYQKLKYDKSPKVDKDLDDLIKSFEKNIDFDERKTLIFNEEKDKTNYKDYNDGR